MKIKTACSFKKLAKFADNFIEIHADEVIKVENAEVIYTDILVQALFVNDKLGDQEVFNEPELEELPLGTCGNYRLKIMVSTTISA